MSERAAPRQTCRDHCQACNQHFSGLGAFDAHLNWNGERTECCEGAAAIIIGKDKRIRAALQVWSDDGWCELQNGCYVDGKRVKWEHPVVVWQVAMTEAQRERLQHAFGRRGEESEPLSAEGGL